MDDKLLKMAKRAILDLSSDYIDACNALRVVPETPVSVVQFWKAVREEEVGTTDTPPQDADAGDSIEPPF